MKGLSGEKLRVNVDRIPDEGLTIRASESTDRFPVLKDAALEGELGFDAPLQMEVQLRRISGLVEASGLLRTSVRLSCSRCLGAFSQLLSTPFGATYGEEAPLQEELREDDEIELIADTIDLFPIHDREVDLHEAIQEQVLLALPPKPLCQVDCKGLCPGCGADLNQGACECTEKPMDPRFAALKGLKINKD